MKLSTACAALLGLVLVIALVTGTPMLRGALPAEKPKQFIYVLRLVPRLYEEKAWTKEDREIAMRHFERLKAAGEHGPVILAGRTEEPAQKTFGIVIFEMPDATAANAFMENDPAVKAGIMTAELHPYLVAVQRNP
jgi:uncharacterized protein YciI